jgi:hypothetical protein
VLAQNIRKEGRQLAQGSDVRHSSRRDVLDPSGHAARRLGTHVEMQHEGAVGGQFKRGLGGRLLMRSGRVRRLLHDSDDTARRRHARWNGREIAVRKR